MDQIPERYNGFFPLPETSEAIAREKSIVSFWKSQAAGKTSLAPEGTDFQFLSIFGMLPTHEY